MVADRRGLGAYLGFFPFFVFPPLFFPGFILLITSCIGVVEPEPKARAVKSGVEERVVKQRTTGAAG